jgi:hypothetical protein
MVTVKTALRIWASYTVATMVLIGLLSCGRNEGTMAPPHEPAAPGSWQEREARLDDMKKRNPAEISDADKVLLIGWLAHDATVRPEFTEEEKQSAEAEDGYGDYVTQLALTVASLKDSRAILALVKVMDISQGICTAIAEFGDAAVDPVIGALANPDLDIRLGAVDTLGFLLKGQQLKKNALSDPSAERIQAELDKITADPEPLIRQVAVHSLEFAKPTSETRNLISNLLTSDPAVDVRTIDGPPHNIYPVRDEAAATLKAWAQSAAR